jgi:hypothetical protein
VIGRGERKGRCDCGRSGDEVDCNEWICIQGKGRTEVRLLLMAMMVDSVAHCVAAVKARMSEDAMIKSEETDVDSQSESTRLCRWKKGRVTVLVFADRAEAREVETKTTSMVKSFSS